MTESHSVGEYFAKSQRESLIQLDSHPKESQGRKMDLSAVVVDDEVALFATFCCHSKRAVS